MTDHTDLIVTQANRDAAAWALDPAPDHMTWEILTAHYRTPDQKWQAYRVAKAFARHRTTAHAALAAENAQLTADNARLRAFVGECDMTPEGEHAKLIVANAQLTALVGEASVLIRDSQFHLRIDMGARIYHEKAEAFLARLRAFTLAVVGLGKIAAMKGDDQ